MSNFSRLYAFKSQFISTFLTHSKWALEIYLKYVQWRIICGKNCRVITEAYYDFTSKKNEKIFKCFKVNPGIHLEIIRKPAASKNTSQTSLPPRYLALDWRFGGGSGTVDN